MKSQLKYDSILTKEFLIQRYIIEDCTRRDIANEIKCTIATIKRYLKRYDIQKYPKISESRIQYRLNSNYLIKEYIDNNRTINEIATSLGCSRETVKRGLVKFNIFKGHNDIHILDDSKIIKLYLIDRLSLDDIGKLYNVSRRVIELRLLRNNVEIRQAKEPVLDFTGRRIGSILVLEFDRTIKIKDSETLHTVKAWKCLCNCGNIIYYSSDLLNSNPDTKKRLSCRKCFEYIGLPSWYFITLKKGAKRKNRQLEFNITPKYMWELFLKQNERCVFSGVKLSFIKTSTEKYKQTASLDRIDNDIGYVEGNVQWVYKDLNFMRGSLSIDKFLKLCKSVSDYSFGEKICAS